MRILTTGSRDWEGIAAEAKIQVVLNVILALADVLGQELTVVHGNCPTGADPCVDRWARRRDDQVTLEPHPADWRRLGKRAGPVRNQEMVDLGADMCLGFLKDGSTGTRNCLALARHAGIPTFVVPWESGWQAVPLEEARNVA